MTDAQQAPRRLKTYTGSQGYVYQYYKTGGDSNTGYSDPKMDDLLEQARTALSTAIEMYQSMEMTFWLPETEAALAQVEGR